VSYVLISSADTSLTARGDVRAHGLPRVREEDPEGGAAAGRRARRGDRHGAAEGDGERGRGAEEGAQGGAADGPARRPVAAPVRRGRGRRRGRRRRRARPGAAAAHVPARRRGPGGARQPRGAAHVLVQLLQAWLRRLAHVRRLLPPRCQLGRRRHQDHRLLQRRERAGVLRHVIGRIPMSHM